MALGTSIFVLPLLRAAVGLGFATPQAKSKAEKRLRLLVSCVQKKSKAEKCLRLLVSCVQKLAAVGVLRRSGEELVPSAQCLVRRCHGAGFSWVRVGRQPVLAGELHSTNEAVAQSLQKTSLL